MLCSMSALAPFGFLTVTSGDSLPASPKILCLMFIAPLHSVELKRRLWAIRERAGMRQPGCVSKQDGRVRPRMNVALKREPDRVSWVATCDHLSLAPVGSARIGQPLSL